MKYILSIRIGYAAVAVMVMLFCTGLHAQVTPHVTVGGSIFGGGNKANVTGNSTVLINQAGAVVETDVYGGGALADVNVTASADEPPTYQATAGKVTTVTISQGTVTRNVYGGGLGSNEMGNEVAAKVFGPVTVTINGGTVNNNVYGCNNLLGAPQNTVEVNISSGTVTKDVYGGGNIASTESSVQPVVNITGGSIGQDVYGGGALADVGSTTVNILGGTVTGNVYGGGLGRKASGADAAIAASVNGTATVNIGKLEDELDANGFATTVSGEATIGGSVYGCNNASGTPTGDATVHIYKTHRETSEETSGSGFALYQVFGGGNQANYEPASSDNKAVVHVWTCDNTIQYIYGGGNAADLGTTSVNSATEVIIDGGRHQWVFGGGNGYSASNNHLDPEGEDYNPGANIFGNTKVSFHAGYITYIFGGSNQWGDISGSKTVDIVSDGVCVTKHITELYGGNNEAPTTGDVSLSMSCRSNSCEINYLFGGSRNADIGTSEHPANVELTVYGGEYNYVFGGNNLGGTIYGNVTLNLYGGTINEAAFGGNKGGLDENSVFHDGGSITGNVTVYVEDKNTECPLEVKDVFGAGDLALYNAPMGVGAQTNNPVVYVNHLREGKSITGNVYGGGNGDPADNTQAKGSVSGNPKVVVGDVSDGHESYRASINGNVYGGGNAAKVTGNTTVLMQNSNSTVGRDIYGGGNLADVSGSVVVEVTGGTVTQDVYGGGALADVNVTNGALTTGATTTVTLDGGSVRYLYGGGLGRNGDSPIAAKVYGPVVVTVNSGTATNVFGCNNFNGAPQGDVQVNINETTADAMTISANVYGGGNLAAYTGTPDVNIIAGVVTGSVFGGGNQAGVGGGDVTMTGGQVLAGIYGGCNTSGTVSGDIAVNINAGTVGTDATHTANIHGGGYGASTATTGDIVVNIAQTEAATGPTIWGDVYGGSALGNVNAANKSTTVTLNKGTINGDLYGGGLGEAEHPAAVYGAVQVTVNSGTVTGSVYGCNNVNGAPQSTVAVDIYGTDVPGSGYALGHVFGGGNQAAYGGTPVVKVHNCNNSIEYVYGGGNKASVAGTNVVIYGGNTIGSVFGGGNGEGVAVDYTMVSGNASANIYGGTIGKVFGGNNSSGTINGTITVNVSKQIETGEGHTLCDMKIGEVYGGGNLAAGQAGTINIGCTGDLVVLADGEHYGIDKEGIRYVYGGANQAGINTNIVVNINSGIIENVYGGNNISGTISGTIQVNINKDDDASCASHWYVGDVFGGGNEALYSYTPDVNIMNGTVSGSVFGGGNEAGVGGGDVTMTGGTVLTGLYGGCNSSGNVSGDIVVTVTGGTVGSSAKLDNLITSDVFGGGYGSSTTTSGNVIVNIGDASSGPTIYGDVYGGSALGEVNSAGKTTTVNILNGTIETKTTTGTTANNNDYYIYHGGNVYGGGLGKKAVPDDPDIEGDQSEAAIEAKVYGRVTVNIGTFTADAVSTSDGDHTGNEYTGNATIKGNVYGCNNTYGSPQNDVTVNIYSTAHTDGTGGTTDNTVSGTGYAIANVFGGGNEADFTVGKIAAINVFGCDNTIERTFGGGNAAATNSVITTIYGGRIHETYGGGNGEVRGADIIGTVTLNTHGGTIGSSVAGSNMQGDISTGISNTTIDNAGCGGTIVEEHFCGNNASVREGNVYATITCEEPVVCKNLYGGSKQADIRAKGNPGDPDYQPGDVHLTVKGGTYENVYGGSQGTTTTGANIAGNVQLDIYGGTITNAIYGGSHIKGNIGGTVIVNVEDKYPNDACALDVSRATVYGGGNLADYPGEGINHSVPYDYPQVNIKNATVLNVFGGGLEAEVTGNPQVRLKNKAVILGNVYGGGNMGVVNGKPRVILNGKQTN